MVACVYAADVASQSSAAVSSNAALRQSALKDAVDCAQEGSVSPTANCQGCSLGRPTSFAVEAAAAEAAAAEALALLAKVTTQFLSFMLRLHKDTGELRL